MKITKQRSVWMGWMFVLLCAVAVPIVRAADPQPNAARQRLLDKLRERRAKTPPENSVKPANGVLSLTHAGQLRTYRLHRPRGAAEGRAMPLVIVMHGLGADGGMTQALSGFDAIADKHGFAVVYPDGLGRMWRFWENLDGKIANGSTDDVGFIAALIDQFVKEGLVDRRRVYATGISNGGYMSNRLGCSLSDKIAAIAPVAGSMLKLTTEQLRPSRVMPTMTFHGTADHIVQQNGTDAITKLGLSLSASEVAAWWAKANGCATVPQTESLPDKVDDGTRVVRHTYRTAKDEPLVVYYEIEGGGHTWPGGNFQPEVLLGKTSKEIVASELIWEFFRQHALPNR